MSIQDLEVLYNRHDTDLDRRMRTADVWNFIHEFVFHNYAHYGSMFQ